MPVSVGTDLNVVDNLLNAEYGNLYNRLNKAVCYSYNGNNVYVVSYAAVGDNVYTDTECRTSSTIVSITATTLVDSNSYTYTRNTDGDSSFAIIPSEAINHEVTAQEFLDATNPLNTDSTTTSRTLTITSNGTYDVRGYTSVVVNIS